MLGVKTVTSALVAFLLVSGTATAALGPVAGEAKDDFNSEVVLSFTAPVDPGISTAVVIGPSGRIPIGSLQGGNTVGDLVVPVPSNLEPGVYVIHFSAQAVNGQRVIGTSSLTVPERPTRNGSLLPASLTSGR